MKRTLGIVSAGIVAALCLVLPVLAGAPAGPTNEDCLGCHADKGLTKEVKGKKLSLYADEAVLKASVHGRLACTACHADIKEVARLASSLNHPHICTIYEVGETDASTDSAGTSQAGSPQRAAYIAMELVEGQPLSARLAGGALPLEQVLRYGQQLADALAHAHARRVVHRDFKSPNVVITPEGRAEVLAFGLARRLTDEQLADVTVSRHSLTAPGMVAGTLAYMAPEHLRGQPADERSEIWALGVVLYEMAGGLRPFRGQTGFELTSAILKELPPPLPSAVPVPSGARRPSRRTARPRRCAASSRLGRKTSTWGRTRRSSAGQSTAPGMWPAPCAASTDAMSSEVIAPRRWAAPISRTSSSPSFAMSPAMSGG